MNDESTRLVRAGGVMKEVGLDKESWLARGPEVISLQDFRWLSDDHGDYWAATYKNLETGALGR